jgi:serine protease Do
LRGDGNQLENAEENRVCGQAMIEKTPQLFEILKKGFELLLALIFFLAGSHQHGFAFQSTVEDPRQKRLTSEQWRQIEAIQTHRIQAIEQVVGSVISIYGENREGGGSGVIIDPSGIALTNHHVMLGAGVSGWGGLADGNMYHWKLVGTDPGGDVSIIQLEGRDDFPFTWLGDSDLVKIGDWALAMGNPFVLTEDQFPTVTLGIVSGIKRYQPGAGANQLVYGNCIQVDSSINPGNSGGPLFDLFGHVIGINGRGSFKDRGRVNVGLGYAISSNQIKNFIPDLLATKLVQHGTLDASFSDRQGKVVCSTINREAPIALAGLSLGDELLEFEGEKIHSVNQFTNLICTLPADWPATLKIRKTSQETLTIHSRLLGLPYPLPGQAENPSLPPGQPDNEQTRQLQAMVKLLSAPAGVVREIEINRAYARQIIKNWKSTSLFVKESEPKTPPVVPAIYLVDDLKIRDQIVGRQTIHFNRAGRFRIEWQQNETQRVYWFDGTSFFIQSDDEAPRPLSLMDAKMSLPVVQALGMMAPNHVRPFEPFGAYSIDGGDKAQNRPTYRLLQVDSERDKFYFWLSVERENGDRGHQLLKASADNNCSGEGGVLFSDWKISSFTKDDQALEFLLPVNRAFVRGLEENENLSIENREVNWISEIDPAFFSPPQ